MHYGDIVGQTVRVIWRNKILWAFGVIGLVLTITTYSLYAAAILAGQQWLMGMMADLAASPAAMEDGATRAMGSAMLLFLGGIGLVLLLALAGYVINLVMRAATIDQARQAWEGHAPAFAAGLRTGARQLLRLFLLDLLWFLPMLAVTLLVIGGAATAFVGSMGALQNESAAGFMSFMTAFIGLICSVYCVIFVMAAVKAVLAPMMVQSLIQRQAGLGAAIRDGWNLARNNLGVMIIFALVMLGGYLAVYTLMQVAGMPLSFVVMSGYMSNINALMAGAAPQVSPVSGLGMLFGVLVMALVMLAAASFFQTYGLVMYAQVYRELTMGRQAGH